MMSQLKHASEIKWGVSRVMWFRILHVGPWTAHLCSSPLSCCHFAASVVMETPPEATSDKSSSTSETPGDTAVNRCVAAVSRYLSSGVDCGIKKSSVTFCIALTRDSTFLSVNDSKIVVFVSLELFYRWKHLIWCLWLLLLLFSNVWRCLFGSSHWSPAPSRLYLRIIG